MQLVAYGAQDIYLTGNPQITFWKVVYRRHTNFARESIQQTFNGTVGFGNRVSATISRNGDLLSKLWIECDPSACVSDEIFTPNPLHQMLKEVEVQIGGQQIDKIYGHWLNVWTELTEKTHVSILDSTNGLYRSSDQSKGDGGEVRKAPTAYQRMAFGVKSSGTTDVAEKYACVPLPFWFCRNPGLALPLIALQYHEVKLNITFDTDANISSGSGSLSSVELWCDYVYLDTDERRRFAQVSHEYLIEQLQYQSFSAASTFSLNLNHPVKEIMFAGQRAAGAGGNGSSATPMPVALHSDASTKLSRTDGSTGGKITLKLNGHERFAKKHINYFTRTQAYEHHPNCGGGAQADAIGVYSFALEPEEHQPSGTCNFSRIDTAQLVFDNKVCGGSASEGLHVYALNYNVLRIMSGMGGLAYSN
jgi:hypothetical protein